MNFLSKTGETTLRVVAVGVSVVLLAGLAAIMLPVIAVSLLVTLAVAALALIAAGALVIWNWLAPQHVTKVVLKIDAWMDRVENERARNRPLDGEEA